MKSETLSPVAARVIEKCGGHKAVSLLTGAKLSAVYRWTYARSKGGRGGEIPREPRAKLVEAARAGVVDLVASDFIDLPDEPRKRTARARS